MEMDGRFITIALVIAPGKTQLRNGLIMNDSSIPSSLILAELLRIQRWAGGDSVSAGRIFGLMHGVETVVKRENASFGISESTQRKVEDVLEDVDRGKQSADGMSIKDRLRRDGVDETDAAKIMELCRLQSRFGPAIKKIVNGQGSVFSYLDNKRVPEQDWFGALHYMELVECLEDSRNKLHPIFAASVPRVGEVVYPHRGSAMRVVGVEYEIAPQSRELGLSHHYLVPSVLLEAIPD